MLCEKLSFNEVVDKFTAKFGVEWCSNINTTESVVDTFIDYIKSMSAEQFDYEKVNNLL